MAVSRPVSIINAPTNLGLSSLYPGHLPGTSKAPAALRALGLHAGLKAASDRMVTPPHRSGSYVDGSIRHIDEIAAYSADLAAEIGEALEKKHFVLMLGGDCSILLGAGLASARAGISGLLHIDGHTDFYLPEQSTTGGAAGMDLALACGWGPDALVNIDGRSPYFAPERTAALGNRDFDPSPEADLPPIETALGCYLPLPELRRIGSLDAINRALETVSPNGEPFWIHLDVDVLDNTIMPAVDSPQPDGLSLLELEEILGAALKGNAAGLQVTIYDPDKDSDRKAGKVLVDLLTRLLAP